MSIDEVEALLDRLEQAEARNAKLERVAELAEQASHGTPESTAAAWHELYDALAVLNKPDVPSCRKCGVMMEPGKAIEQTYTAGTPDFPARLIRTARP